MEELRIIVAGGRDFDDYTKLKAAMFDVVYDFKKRYGEDFDIKIISGTARGADRLGERYAKEKGYEVVRFPADWDKLGKRAGYVRNAEMAKYAISDGNIGVLVAFWDGSSRGTKHMIDLANKNGLEVFIVGY